MPSSVPYTRLPRPTLWLLRGDDDRDVRAIYISKSPITNEEYEAYDPAHARAACSPGDRHPVVNVTFDDAAGYCRWYAEASGKAFRLPSEAEWEFACRAGTSGRTFWGDDLAAGDPFVWDERTSGGTCQDIETRQANGNGLHDMLGHVWEWTDTEAGADRVIRGGSFRTPRAELGCDLRDRVAPAVRRDDLGFRIVRFL